MTIWRCLGMTNIEYIQSLSILGFVEAMPHLNLLRGTIGGGEFTRWLTKSVDGEFWNKVFV